MNKGDMLLVQLETLSFLLDGGRCDAAELGRLRDAVKQPAEQHQGEPDELKVLGYSVKGNRYAIRLTKGELIELHPEYSGDSLIELVDRRHVTKLQGEVERLREDAVTQKAVADEAWAEVEKCRNNSKTITQQVDTLRAELAEAHALLRDIKAEGATWPLRKSLVSRLETALANGAALSASAAECGKCGSLNVDACTSNGCWFESEPSAPVERDERAAFQLGDSVRKKSGSEWEGTVVGTYSTDLTPEGYCVESSTHAGSVQIYPAAALERKP